MSQQQPEEHHGEDGLRPQRRVVIVRHASTPWSRGGQHTGRTDIPLDEDGRAAALRLAERLPREDVVQVLSSPLSRALDTCRLAGFGDRVELDEDLLEWDYGDYEGRTTADIQRERPGWRLFFDGCPNGEDAAAVGRRVDRVIKTLLEEPVGTTLVFAHGHVLRVLGVRWLDLVPEEARRLSLGTGAVCELGFEHGERAVLRWNL